MLMTLSIHKTITHYMKTADYLLKQRIVSVTADKNYSLNYVPFAAFFLIQCYLQSSASCSKLSKQTKWRVHNKEEEKRL